MPNLQEQNERRALDRWARRTGYSDFDSYIRLGGSIADCRSSLEHQHGMIGWAMRALFRYQADIEIAAERHAATTGSPNIGEHALARAEAEVSGELVDPGNAQIQGFDT